MSFARPAQHYRLAFPLIPMIDLMFVLVIFFVTTTSFTADEQQIDVKLPLTQTGAPPEAHPSELIVNIQAGGAITVGGRPYDLEQFRTMLGQLVADYPNERLIIRGDKTVTYDRIVGIMDAARSVGVRNIYFATVKKAQDVGG
jgi:biopolymer transport protein ExbD